MPYDFYTNVRDAAEQEAQKIAGALGQPDIFFDGDNNDRNGQKQSHLWTRAVTPEFLGSLDFLEKVRQKDWFSHLIRFTRGKVAFSALVSVRAWVHEGKCTAAAFSCTKTSTASDGTTRCAPDGW